MNPSPFGSAVTHGGPSVRSRLGLAQDEVLQEPNRLVHTLGRRSLETRELERGLRHLQSVRVLADDPLSEVGRLLRHSPLVAIRAPIASSAVARPGAQHR